MRKKVPILQSIFCHVISLHEYLQNLGIQNVTPDEPTLSQLRSVVVAFRHNDEIYPSKYSLSHEHDTLFIIYRAIEKSCHKNIDNIISQGFSCMRQNSKKSFIPGTAFIELNGVDNTIVTYLTTTPWKCLHASIGDDVFFYLLTKSFMFLSIGNDCFIQLCGIPLYQLKLKGNCDCRIRKDFSVVRQNVGIHEIPVTDNVNRNRVDEVEEKDDVRPTCKADVRPNLKADVQPNLKADVQPNCKADVFSALNPCKVDEIPRVQGTKRKCSELKVKMNKKRKIGTLVSNESKTALEINELKKPKLLRKTCKQKRDYDRKTLDIGSPAASKPCSLRRFKMFYSSSSEGLSKKFILHKIPASNKGVTILMENIFGIPQGSKRCPRSLLAVKDVLKKVIVIFKMVKFKVLLNYYCPCSDWLRKKGNVSYEEAVDSFLPTKKVFLFLRKVIKRILPEELFGDRTNLNLFISYIKKLLMLGRYETIDPLHLVNRVKITSISWLKNTGTNKEQRELNKTYITKLVTWLFNRLIIPLISCYFYVTETGWSGNKVFFYRKKTWDRISNEGLKDLVGTMYAPISEKEVMSRISMKKALGIFPVRLIPGKEKLRPIAVMNKSHFKDSKKPFSLNTKLEDIHYAFQYETSKNNQILGASLSDHQDIYKRWTSYVKNIKPSGKRLSIASIDISRCYDTLSQRKLLEIVPTILQERNYHFRKFVKVKLANGVLRKKFTKFCSDEFDCDNFVDFVLKNRSNGRLHGKGIVYVYIRNRYVDRPSLLELYEKHVSQSIGCIKKVYYEQKRGVPQGSILASISNNIHYGSIESKDLTEFLSSENSLLLRWVDDYIFVSTDEIVARNFVHCIHECLVKYGCSMNWRKSLVNFDLSVDGFKVPKCASPWFPWCGYLVNDVTKEFSFNYSKYYGSRLKHSMTIQYDGQSGAWMYKNLLRSLDVKASCIVLDNELNSIQNIHKNVYQIFLYLALRFHVYVVALSKYHKNAMSDSFLLHIIRTIPSRFLEGCRRKFQNIGLEYLKKLSLTLNVVKWICYQAFVDVLQRRATRYKKVLPSLKKELKLLAVVSEHVDITALRLESRLFSTIKV